jgi:hypothetical protein
MRGLLETTGRFGLVCLVILGLGSIATLLAGWAGSRPVATPRAATALVVGLADQSEVTASIPSDAEVLPSKWPVLDLFSPALTDPRVASWSPAPETEPATPQAAPSPGSAPAPASAEAAKADRPGALFTDAQIASIKSRLKLTSRQMRHWPAVEAALRDLNWQDKRGGRRSKDHLLTLEASKVQQLNVAAKPLMDSLTEEQKREVRTLAHVVGLDRVASGL